MFRFIVIADATEARILSIDDQDLSIELVRQLIHPESRTHASNNDRLGRLRKGMGSQTRSAMEPRTDPHTAEMERFAREIGDALKAVYDQHHFNDLAVVAPPKFLGLLRTQIEIHNIRCLRLTVARNGTHIAVQDLPEQCGDAFGKWFRGKRESIESPKRRRNIASGYSKKI